MAASFRLAAFALLTLSACSGDEAGAATFTTRGQLAMESGIPAGEGGFVDGWSLQYQRFLVSFHQIQVATESGEVAQISPASYFVDNAVPGSKQLVSFHDVTAKAWQRVSYQIKPAIATAVVVAGEAADLQMSVGAGYSLYCAGTATKGTVTKAFAFGFQEATQYDVCRAHQGGRDVAGIVVTDGREDISELTIHGDHLFHDRLHDATVGEARTSLRFDAIAAADDAGDGDGVITLEELEQQPVDLQLYDPTGLSGANMKEWLSGLSRTVGHFRGDGECRRAAAE